MNIYARSSSRKRLVTTATSVSLWNGQRPFSLFVYSNTTHDTSGSVTELSAMLVARMTRAARGLGTNILTCSSSATMEWHITTSS